MGGMKKSIFALAALALAPALAEEGWIELFNGRDLSGWTPKIRHSPCGENPGNTFRVEDGLLKVRYDDPFYKDGFKERFGHLFWKNPFTNFVLRCEYRFVGEQTPDGPGWARRNNGVMLLGQTPETMKLDQSFPDSIEFQLLGGFGSGKRSTANLCTPGTQVVYEDKLYTPHTLNSSSDTYPGDQWVTVEAEVRDGHVVFRAGGRDVLAFDDPQLDDGTPIRSGTISIQSESAPTDFRRIAVKPLPSAPATFANPVIPHDFPDPTFWEGGDGWFYGTATGGGTLKTVHRSRDLVAWEDTKQPTIAPEDLPKLHAFAKTFWAPDMVKVGDSYRLYVTQFISSDTNRLVVLTGAKPQGPFRFAGVVVENWKFGKKDLGIDSEVVRDADGTLRLFIGSVAGGVWRTRLTDDGLALAPCAAFEHVAGLVPARDDRGWIYSHRCYEGSYLFRRGDWWYLFVSCGAIHGGSYKLCVGRAKSLTDDFVDRSGKSLREGGGEILLQTDPKSDFSGAGHNGEIFTDADGRTFMFIHSQWKGTGGRNWRNGARCTSLQEVRWTADGWPWFETGALLPREKNPRVTVR